MIAKQLFWREGGGSRFQGINQHEIRLRNAEWRGEITNRPKTRTIVASMVEHRPSLKKPGSGGAGNATYT